MLETNKPFILELFEFGKLNLSTTYQFICVHWFICIQHFSIAALLEGNSRTDSVNPTADKIRKFYNVCMDLGKMFSTLITYYRRKTFCFRYFLFFSLPPLSNVNVYPFPFLVFSMYRK